MTRSFFWSKAVFTMREIRESVDELALPAGLILQKNLADGVDSV